MNLFSDHIPPEFLTNNVNVANFVKVLDGLQFYKNGELSRLENFLNFYVQLDFVSQKRFLDTFGKIPKFSFLSKSQFIKLIENNFDIWTYKGSKKGRDAFFLNVFGFESSYEAETDWWSPLIFQLDDINYGILPDGVDLGVATATPNKYPFLVADNLTNYYNRVVLTLTNTHVILDTTSKRKEFCAFLPNLLVMSDLRTCLYTVNFKNSSNTIIETLNF